MKIGEERIVKGTEKSREVKDMKGMIVLISPKNFKIREEIITKYIGKSREFEELTRNDCKIYWRVRRI